MGEEVFISLASRRGARIEFDWIRRVLYFVAMRFILVFGFIVFVSSAFAHEDCSLLLRDGSYKALLNQVQRLNPQILTSESPSLAQVYIALKQQTEISGLVSDRLAENLRATQAKHFVTPELNREDLTRFYQNALRALINRTADLWRRREIGTLAGRPLKPRLQNFAEHLLDTFFSPNGLNDQSLTSDEAKDYFARRPWTAYPWVKILAAMENEVERPPAAAQIPAWVEWNEANRIRVALQADRRPGECCLSSPACTLCPHNRGWLKRD